MPIDKEKLTKRRDERKAQEPARGKANSQTSKESSSKIQFAQEFFADSVGSKKTKRGSANSNANAVVIYDYPLPNNPDCRQRRLGIGADIIEKLGNPEELKFGFKRDSFFFGEELPIDAKGYPVKVSGNNRIIYYAALIREILEHTDLEIDDNVTKFEDIEFMDFEGTAIAIVKVNK